MSFCRLSNQNYDNSITPISNKFITDFCLEADALQLKVYLYGLYLCSTPVEANNSIVAISLALNCTEEDIYSAMRFWESMGAVSIVCNEPLQVVYNPIDGDQYIPKKYKKEEYSDFNVQLQSLFTTRTLSPYEYLKYYELMDDTGLTKEAMLMIAGHCVSLKGSNIKYPYIIAVAKDWARSGVRSVEDIEEKMQEYNSNTESIRIIAKELGKKSAVDLDDNKMYAKWTQVWGYDFESILFVAKQCKKRGGMLRLDKMLDEYFRFGCLSLADIKAYAVEKDKLFELTKTVVKILGLRYEDLSFIVESYTQVWINKGFEEDAIIAIAKHCFKKSVRTLDGMNKIISTFEAQGCFSITAINQYIDTLVTRDKEISAIIEATGSSRSVTNSDRDNYYRWCQWGFSSELMIYAASLAQGRPYAFGYINAILSKWKDAKVTTLEQAKAFPVDKQQQKPVQDANAGIVTKEYTKEELDALFDVFKELEE